MPRKKKPESPKASDAAIELRVQAVLQLILDGAQYWNIQQYAAEKQAAGEAPWNRGPNQKLLSERQLREYMARAGERIIAAAKETGANALETHISMRHSLYARALEAGELHTALMILSDLAKLTDLYPAPKKQDININSGLRMEFVEVLVDDPGGAPDAGDQTTAN